MVKYEIKKHVLDSLTFSTGEAVFIDGETKNGNFDTLNDPIDLALFSHGELRLKLEEMSGSPSFQVSIGNIDELTSEFYKQAETPILTTDTTRQVLIGKEFDSFIGSRMAIKAMLSGGSFKVTITGEFKK